MVCGGLCVCFRMCLVYGLVSVLIVGCLMRCWFSVVFCVVLTVFVIVAVRLFLVCDLVLVVRVWFWCWLACCMFGVVRGFRFVFDLVMFVFCLNLLVFLS